MLITVAIMVVTLELVGTEYHQIKKTVSYCLFFKSKRTNTHAKNTITHIAPRTQIPLDRERELCEMLVSMFVFPCPQGNSCPIS